MKPDTETIPRESSRAYYLMFKCLFWGVSNNYKLQLLPCRRNNILLISSTVQAPSEHTRLPSMELGRAGASSTCLPVGIPSHRSVTKILSKYIPEYIAPRKLIINIAHTREKRSCRKPRTWFPSWLSGSCTTSCRFILYWAAVEKLEDAYPHSEPICYPVGN